MKERKKLFYIIICGSRNRSDCLYHLISGDKMMSNAQESVLNEILAALLYITNDSLKYTLQYSFSKQAIAVYENS